MSDEINLGAIPAKPLPQDAAWKLHAVQLAVTKHLAGRAKFVRFARVRDPNTKISLGSYNYYTCASQSEPVNHDVVYDLDVDSVHCDCPAGMHNTPCAHAGAVLLCQCGLAPQDGVVEPEAFHG